ncbi:MAG: hypothetical protein K1X71_06225 [Pirellulales bacterium]|nr:hypothetical protein [Pirellulales bacterium]
MTVLPGDGNRDNVVNGADYTLWSDHYQQSGGFGEGDWNGDSYVDGADYSIWADRFHLDYTTWPTGGSGLMAMGGGESEMSDEERQQAIHDELLALYQTKQRSLAKDAAALLGLNAQAAKVMSFDAFFAELSQW